MIHIKKFIEKVSLLESKNNKDLVLPMIEARGLRDELAKLLADSFKILNEKKPTEQNIQIEIKGGTFK